MLDNLARRICNRSRPLESLGVGTQKMAFLVAAYSLSTASPWRLGGFLPFFHLLGLIKSEFYGRFQIAHPDSIQDLKI